MQQHCYPFQTMNSLLLCNLTEGQQNRLIVYLKMFLFATLVFVECYEAFSVCVPTVAKHWSCLTYFPYNNFSHSVCCPLQYCTYYTSGRKDFVIESLPSACMQSEVYGTCPMCVCLCLCACVCVCVCVLLLFLAHIEQYIASKSILVTLRSSIFHFL